MPITGNAATVLKNMIATHGEKDGTAMFYATANKQKRTPETREKTGMDASTAALLGGGMGALGGGVLGTLGVGTYNAGVERIDAVNRLRADAGLHVDPSPNRANAPLVAGTVAAGGAAAGALTGLGAFGAGVLLARLLSKRKAR